MQTYRRLLCLFLICAALSANSQTWEPDPKEQEGFATYYADRFHGRSTAYGETYDRQAMTCASQTFPKNSLLRVTRQDTRKSVLVRVNDRGPFGKENYVIDLSYAAAQELDMIQEGRVWVQIKKVGTSNQTPAAPRSSSTRRALARRGNTDSSAGSVSVSPPTYSRNQTDRPSESRWITGTQNAYGVQLAAYTQRTYAQRQFQEWTDQGIHDLYVWQDDDGTYRLIAGSYRQRAQAVDRQKAIQNTYNLNGFVRRY